MCHAAQQTHNYSTTFQGQCLAGPYVCARLATTERVRCGYCLQVRPCALTRPALTLMTQSMHQQSYCLWTLSCTNPLRPYSAALGNVLPVPRAGGANSTDVRPLPHMSEPVSDESESESSLSREPVPLEMCRCGLGASPMSHEIEIRIPSVVALLPVPPPIRSHSLPITACRNSSVLTCVRSLCRVISASILCSRVPANGGPGRLSGRKHNSLALRVLGNLDCRCLRTTLSRQLTAVRSAKAVVKLLPRENEPALVAPIALATSAIETGQNRPE